MSQIGLKTSLKKVLGSKALCYRHSHCHRPMSKSSSKQKIISYIYIPSEGLPTSSRLSLFSVPSDKQGWMDEMEKGHQ